MKSHVVKKDEGPLIVPVTNQNGELIAAKSPDHSPARIVYYIETAGMDQKQIVTLIAAIRSQYQANTKDKYYIIPVVNGKVTKADLRFEDEILSMVNELCEIKDNQIVMRPGYEKIRILREYVE